MLGIHPDPNWPSEEVRAEIIGMFARGELPPINCPKQAYLIAKLNRNNSDKSL